MLPSRRVDRSQLAGLGRVNVAHRRLDVRVIHHGLDVSQVCPVRRRPCAERVTARAVKRYVLDPGILERLFPRRLDLANRPARPLVLEQATVQPRGLTEPLKYREDVRVNRDQA
jgi:hypothetical protein